MRDAKRDAFRDLRCNFLSDDLSLKRERKRKKGMNRIISCSRVTESLGKINLRGGMQADAAGCQK